MIYELLKQRQEMTQKIEEVDRYIMNVIMNARTKLSRKYYHVLKLRFRDRLTLEECGKDLGVTRERVRIIQDKALAIIDAINKYEDSNRDSNL